MDSYEIGDYVRRFPPPNNPLRLSVTAPYGQPMLCNFAQLDNRLYWYMIASVAGRWQLNWTLPDGTVSVDEFEVINGRTY